MEATKIVEQCYKRLPQEMREAPWLYTDHGRKLLETEDDMNAYLAAYGETHIMKCQAALQHFPFDQMRMYQFEIFDWGCGQGLATLTLLDMLRERNMLGGLRRITLIEPSRQTLERAKHWIEESAGPGVTVIGINKFIPSTDNELMDEVSCNSQVSINLFSNILDIRTLSLNWLAHKTATLANINYMICVGPKYTGNTRIEDFCGYFQPQEYFSKISIYPYAYTTRTHHAFGCETRCFMHLRNSNLNGSYKECAPETDFTDDYDYAAECLRNVISDNLLNFYNRIRIKCNRSYDIFLRPSLNTDTVDLVLVGLGKGIVLLNVCDNMDNLPIDINRIENIKKNIFNTHLKTIKIDSVPQHKLYFCVKTILYFPNESQELVKEEIKNILEQQKITSKSEEDEDDERIYINPDILDSLIIIGKDDDPIEILNHLTTNGFKSDYYYELLKIIMGHWHSYKDGDLNFRLSKRQEQIVRSTNQKIRIKGVAGCGKTQIVANRAVEQHLRTGEKVLILTFNISLIQYIRMRISQVPADFAMNMFEIASYHQFFKSKANQYANKKLNLSDWDKSDFFEPYKEKITKYRTIIIDEVQDFKTEWLNSILTYFLKENGSISVFGDGEQNIYGRTLEEDTKMPTVPYFSGRWGEISERVTMRILNKQIIKLAYNFSTTFKDIENKPMVLQDSISLEDYYIKYWNIGNGKNADNIAKNIAWIISHFNLKAKDVAVLGESINLLRDVESSYSLYTHENTMINFETKKQYSDICKQTVKTSTGIIKNIGPIGIKKDLEDVRRVAKTHFTTNCNEIKMSTIHSFKGWEAESIILLLQPINDTFADEQDGYYGILERENMPALIYTALTRAKCNLFIINLGNQTYDEFFRNNITN